jgi:hypothetical protein
LSANSVESDVHYKYKDNFYIAKKISNKILLAVINSWE